MSEQGPRQHKHVDKEKGDQPRIKVRDCLGPDCKDKIKARYPGLCHNCKKRLGRAWESPVQEYTGPHS